MQNEKNRIADACYALYIRLFPTAREKICGGRESLMKPFTTPFQVPPFGEIALEHYVPALEREKKERADLQAIIDKEGGKFKLQSWDWWYYSEKSEKPDTILMRLN